jgi:hypothetical protein
VRQLVGEKVHRSEEIRIVAFDRETIAKLIEKPIDE